MTYVNFITEDRMLRNIYLGVIQKICVKIRGMEGVGNLTHNFMVGEGGVHQFSM